MALDTQKNAWLLEKGFTKAIDIPSTIPATVPVVDGIIKAGTLWPANTGAVEGIVVNDYAVKEKGGMAVMVQGVVAFNLLPVAPAAAALTALKANGIIAFDGSTIK